MDMPDATLVMVMTKGIGANLTNDEKKAHLVDLKREHLINEVCTQEILPPNGSNPSRAVAVRLLHRDEARRQKAAGP
jgi:hypothetical protein